MAQRAPRICRCGLRIAAGELCPCQRRADRAKRARTDAQRGTARERGYDGRWDKARRTFLARHQVCAMPGCGAPSNVVDHVTPHRGDQAKFWNTANWQALCTPCHSGAKQAQEHRDGFSATAAARRMPLGLRSARIPLVIVCGPPGAGKTRYVEEHAGPADLVIDLDAIKADLSGLGFYRAGPEWTARALDERNRMLASLATDTTHERAWFIVSAPTAGERDEWQRRLGAERVEVIAPPLATCVSRIVNDVRRIGQRDRMTRLAERWFELNATAASVDCPPVPIDKGERRFALDFARAGRGEGRNLAQTPGTAPPNQARDFPELGGSKGCGAPATGAQK